MKRYPLQSAKRFTPRVNEAAPTPAFSVGQIAATVGMQRKDVWSALANVEPIETVVRAGNIAPGYSFDELPEPMKVKIENQKAALNYRSAEAVLSDSKKRWQPSRPLGEHAPEAMEYAHCLQRALAFYIAYRNDTGFRAGELLDRAARDWKDAFKKPATRRHVRRAIDRVLERDGGREEFSRLEIYLPDGKESARAEGKGTEELPTLAEAVGVLPDVSALSSAEKATVWRAAMDDLGFLIDAGIGDKKAKRQILNFLVMRVPRLAETPEAARRQLDRKWKAYLQDGVSALADKRREKSGRKRFQRYSGPESLSPDERLLLERANSVGGGISQAFRELHVGTEIAGGHRLQFSEEFRATYSFNPRASKSRVPHRLREKLRPLLRAIEPHNHGPKAARLSSPSIHRDWSGVAAGAYFQSDDETGNSYIWIQREEGEYEFKGMRFDVLRPQILPMVDVRTDYVLSVLLIPRRQYNSRDIRSLILQTCLDERIGLPFDGFYFEGNIWQAKNLHALVNWTEIDEAFSNSGINLRLRHATTPKAKIIERIFSQEQNFMQDLPGYAGRNEMTAGYERVKASLALMKRVGQPRKEEAAPWDHFLSADQYLDQLQRCYERFNAEPQNGKRLNGMSPAEAWEKLSGGRAHHVVPNSLRYLLATEQTEKKVGREGINLPGRSGPRYFLNERLGALIGEKVIVRWNQEFPDHVVVVHPGSDPLGQSPFVVEEDRPLPAIGASSEDFATARQARKEFLTPGRALFRMLNHGYGRTVRDELLGNFTLRLAGEAHEEVVNAEVEAKPTREATAARARKTAARVGIAPEMIKRPDRASGLEMLPDLEAKIRQREALKL